MSDALPAHLLPVTVTPDMFAFLTEFDQAEWGDGIPSSRDYTTVEQIRAQVPTNGTRVWTDYTREKLERAVAGGRFVIVDLWLGSTQTVRHAQRDGVPYQQYLDDRVAWFRELWKKWGNRVWWCICGEQDIGIKFPDRPFASRQEAAAFFKSAHFDAVTPAFPPDPGYGKLSLRKMSDFEMMWDRYHVDFKTEPISMQIAMCFDAHVSFEWGCGLVWLERNVYLTNNQVGIAFLRGAARQYGGLLGLDFSSWGDPTRMTCHFGSDGKRRGGMSENLLLREWVHAFYAGANSLLAESSAACAWMDDGQGGLKLSPYGVNCKKFGEFSLLRHPQRGTPHIPMALMLEHDHGWEPRDRIIWGGTVPYSDADEMIDNFTALAWPGHDRGFYQDEWVRPGCSPQFPFSTTNIQDARAALNRGVDTRPLEKGMLVGSTWGDAFDFVLENCPLDVLAKYPIVLLLGGIRLTSALKEKLDAYVRGGGTVVANSEQTDTEHDAWFGVACDRERLYMDYNYTVSWSGKQYDLGRARHRDLKIVSPDTVGVATCYGKADKPVITERKLGKGKLYFSAFPFMQHKTRSEFSPVCKDFVDFLIRPTLRVDVQGEKPVGYQTNLLDDGVIVTLINSTPEHWRGSIIALDSRLEPARAMELWTDTAVLPASVSEHTLAVALDPFAFAIIRIPNRAQH